MKPYEQEFFEALFWQIKVPIRVIDKTGKVILFKALLKARKYLEPPNIADIKRCNEPQILKIGQHELIGILPVRNEYVVFGPVLVVEPQEIPSLYELILIGDAAAKEVDISEIIPTVSPTRLCAYLRIASLALLRKDIDTNALLERGLNVSKKQIDREFVETRFKHLEGRAKAAFSFKEERRIFDAVREGQEERLNDYLIDLRKYNFHGYMSPNAMRNLKYLAVSVCSIVALAAADGGLPDMEVYVLAGTYFQRIDLSESPEQIYTLLDTMLHDFCGRVKKVRAVGTYTKGVTAAIEYIRAHTHERIFVDTVAKEAGLSKDGLYREFIKQLGMSPAAYILKSKIDEAAELLNSTQYSATEIAAFLAFSSQSHFIAAFKKQKGVTPKEYRKKL